MVTAAIGAAAAVGGALYGEIQSAKFNKQMRDLIQQQRTDNKRWWEITRAKDYLQRPDAMAALKRQRELITEQFKMARARNVVAGGTDESLAMQKAAANDAMAQTYSDVAAAGAADKDQKEQIFRQQDAALNQQQAAGLQQQGQAAAAAGAQVANAGINLVGIGMQKPNYIPKENA